MTGKRVTATLIGLSLAVIATVLLTATPGSGAPRSYTVAYVAGESLHPGGREAAIARGGRAAAHALGIHYLVRETSYNSGDPDGIYRTLIAQHVDAIATEGYDPSLKPSLSRVLAAQIPLLSSGDDIAARRTLWVNQSDAAAYAQALADALASQINGKGEYAIFGEQGQFPIATEWTRLVKSYVANAYPGMKLDGVVTESGAGDPAEVSAVEDYLAAHPNLKGMIGITPTEADVDADAITRTGKIGKVHSAGNGGGDLGSPMPSWVRSGATEFVFAADPFKLGYLTVWAAHWLVTGHTFKAGAYQVGGPIGLVRYYPEHQELRLGQPLTVTKTNIDAYADAF
jgi:rhamnose transport system substrate-binding protein